MTALNRDELEQTAAAYERLLVPAVFEPWTQRIVDAAQVRPGQRVLDVACGTGVLARAAAERVGPHGSVTGLDINPGMLAVAGQKHPEIEWRQGDAQSLPFDDGAFDAVVSQFGLMFFADREAALREMHRVLAPGGHLAVAVFDGLDSAPAYAAMVGVLEREVGAQAADALRMPFVFDDTAELTALFARAGIAGATVTSETRKERFASVADMVRADVEGWFPLAEISVDAATLTTLIERAEAALAPFIASGGAVEFAVPAHIVTAAKS